MTKSRAVDTALPNGYYILMQLINYDTRITAKTKQAILLLAKTIAFEDCTLFLILKINYLYALKQAGLLPHLH
jgi:hypothetical protein